VLADMETPVSAYLRMGGGSGSFLLESVEGGEQLGRYSFVGFAPSARIELRDGVARVDDANGGRDVPFSDPLAVLDELVGRRGAVRAQGLPRFVGGAVGYLSYEIARHFERLPKPPRDPLGLPLGQFLVVETLLVFDHLRRTILVVTHVPLAGELEREYALAERRIDHVIERLRRPLDLPLAGAAAASGLDAQGPVWTSNVSREEFMARVRKAKEYIAAGDIIQVVPSQRLSAQTAAEPFDIYRALRVINPSPYMYFLDFGETQLIGASPELLVLAEEGQVMTHPIAGTRPRGASPEEDQRLAEELLADEKERAEHVMLVDLGRNDIGRVAVPGTVRVPYLMQVERFSHVMHLVSRVTGRLRPDVRPIEALRACFPAGTVSGAPKIRAMEIITELEQEARGTYAGATGFLGFDGNLEMAITLRTILLRGGIAYVQAGGGIVADSDPAAEYEESLNKAAALMRAVEAAERLREGVVPSGRRS
jgi:anthranilate synthase component 1